MDSLVVQEQASDVRVQLLDRRQRLERAIAVAPDTPPLVRLLDEVDSALARVEAGTFGLCEVCHGTVEPTRIAADPLIRTCLDCLTHAQQRALERDLDLAGQVQRQLLPPGDLETGAWTAAYQYQPVGPASGDYVDFVPLDSGEFLFLVGDVSGKGLAASLLMTHLHATVRSLTALRLPFDELLARTNRMFHESVAANQYATLVCGKAGLDGEIVLANAGHCPPIVLAGDRAVSLAPTSVPIGLFAEAPFPAVRLHLAPGETLMVYTDGVTEAVDPLGREYSCDRLVSAAVRNQQLPARDLVERCLSELAAFRGASERHDDLTLFALRRR